MRVSAVMMRRTVRLVGIARTRWHAALAAGSSRATNRKNEWIAASRALRVREEFFRFVSSWSRNALTKGASTSDQNRRCGCGGGARVALGLALSETSFVET